LGVDVHRKTRVLVTTAIASLALPAAAGAATKTVVAGPPIKKPPAGTPKDADIAQFFPSSVKVHVGDSLKFQIAGFHAINLPKKGDGGPPLAVPGPDPVTAVNDAAGAPFWFNGQASFIFNPAVALGTKSGGAYTGAKAVASGAPLSEGAPKPWKVKLTKAGTYTFFCPIHPGMKGTVSVLAKNKAVPSAKADAGRVKAQLATALKRLGKLDKAAPPAGDTITAGPDLGTGETLYRFTPAEKSVKVGAPVTLQMSAGTPEIHTFTFARDINTLKPVAQGFIAPLPGTGTSGPPTLGFSPQALYPSDAPQVPYDGTRHGDGFYNTGVLDGDAKSPQPQNATMTFSAPGTYQYICLVHPEMKGKVVVTP
jgi:plastocyanin